MDEYAQAGSRAGLVHGSGFVDNGRAGLQAGLVQDIRSSLATGAGLVHRRWVDGLPVWFTSSARACGPGSREVAKINHSPYEVVKSGFQAHVKLLDESILTCSKFFMIAFHLKRELCSNAKL
ncbi:hypothetical protein M5K25_021343 [Dendrobium thyrsiflorum]|uniref:Uncharacterized protein n=1 Tax=Dendrobium thyrsiflorum TaxID=117978 RepID=A0ABD0UC86_DENTH